MPQSYITAWLLLSLPNQWMIGKFNIGENIKWYIEYQSFYIDTNIVSKKISIPSPTKCQVIHITQSRNPIKNKYMMHGQILDSVDNAQYLGVDIADDLNFSQHVNRITSNAMKSLGYLKRNVKPSHSGIREAAYKTIVWPQLEYASTVWSPYTKKDIYKVEMIQKRSILWILNSYSTYDSVTAMQLQLFLRSLEQRSAMRAL